MIARESCRRLMQHLAPGLLAVLLFAPGRTAAAQPELPPPGDVRADTTYGRVGDWLALRALDGTTVTREDLAGRVLFVNFWATWCVPCIAEMPTISRLKAALDSTVADGQVAFLLVSIDEDERDVRRFAGEHAPGLPIFFRAWEPGASTFAGGSIPATFIVDRRGEIVYQHHGAADWDAGPIREILAALALED